MTESHIKPISPYEALGDDNDLSQDLVNFINENIKKRLSTNQFSNTDNFNFIRLIIGTSFTLSEKIKIIKLYKESGWKDVVFPVVNIGIESDPIVYIDFYF